MSFDDVVAVFRRHLYLPDPGPLAVVLATVVANRLPGDPVWLLMVGPPASGKTEILSSLSKLPDIHEASTITEAGLLSGSTTRREGATGGLLAEMGAFGIIVCKDFTSVLSESADTRAALLAALREVYDGAWVRRLGTDGGRTRAWSGKAGLLAGVTETIDLHSAAMGAMGERFVLYRMPVLSGPDRLAQGRRAMENTGHQGEMRAELVQAVGSYLDHLVIPRGVPPLGGECGERLLLLTDLATQCRSAVERSARDRDIELVPQHEALGRLQAELTQLTQGPRLLGLDERAVDRLITKVALDAMTKTRRALVELFATAAPTALFTAAEAADRIGLTTSPTARALEDLAAHGVVERQAISGDPHRWRATAWLVERWAIVGEREDPGFASA